ncbi:hypothetical protein ARTHROSP310_08680 [Arthrobacter sp. AD-310]
MAVAVGVGSGTGDGGMVAGVGPSVVFTGVADATGVGRGSTANATPASPGEPAKAAASSNIPTDFKAG